MKKYNYVLVICFIIAMASFSSAEKQDVLRTQGLINPGGNLRAGYLFINETRIYVDKGTQIMNHYGVPIPIAELKPKKFVYLEIEKDPNQGINKAKRIYLLPHYVKASEKQRFSFMK